MGYSVTPRIDCLFLHRPVLEQRHKRGGMDHDILPLHRLDQRLRHSWLCGRRVLFFAVQAISNSRLHDRRYYSDLWRRPFQWYLRRILGSSTLVQPRCFPEWLPWFLLRLCHGCVRLRWYRTRWSSRGRVSQSKQSPPQCHQAGFLADHLVSSSTCPDPRTY